MLRSSSGDSTGRRVTDVEAVGCWTDDCSPREVGAFAMRSLLVVVDVPDRQCRLIGSRRVPYRRAETPQAARIYSPCDGRVISSSEVARRHLIFEGVSV